MAEFEVSDMTCESCVHAITAAVRRVAPAATVSVDLAAKRVRVDGTAADEVVGALRDAGFTPELVAA